jgi:hypothetical protein
MNIALRMLEFNAELDTLIAGGEDEVTAGALAYGSLIADIADYCKMDRNVVFDIIQAAFAEQSAADDQIVAWLRSQMPEPTL